MSKKKTETNSAGPKKPADADEVERQRAAASVAFCGRPDYYPVPESEHASGPAAQRPAGSKKKAMMSPKAKAGVAKESPPAKTAKKASPAKK